MLYMIATKTNQHKNFTIYGSLYAPIHYSGSVIQYLPSHQDGLTPLMVATREPNEEQRTYNVTKEGLTQIAHLLLDSPLTDTNVQEPVCGVYTLQNECVPSTD